jgi:hypothetical protein
VSLLLRVKGVPVARWVNRLWIAVAVVLVGLVLVAAGPSKNS